MPPLGHFTNKESEAEMLVNLLKLKYLRWNLNSDCLQSEPSTST
jgi:hypothetical protein